MPRPIDTSTAAVFLKSSAGQRCTGIFALPKREATISHPAVSGEQQELLLTTVRTKPHRVVQRSHILTHSTGYPSLNRDKKQAYQQQCTALHRARGLLVRPGKLSDTTLIYSSTPITSILHPTTLSQPLATARLRLESPTPRLCTRVRSPNTLSRVRATRKKKKTPHNSFLLPFMPQLCMCPPQVCDAPPSPCLPFHRRLYLTAIARS